MWIERYAGPEYFYGTEPNAFLAEQAHRLQGPVLSLAEGEGRNAVYLASLGLDVHAVDLSDVGLGKAQILARQKGVAIRTEVADLREFEPFSSTRRPTSPCGPGSRPACGCCSGTAARLPDSGPTVDCKQA